MTRIQINCDRSDDADYLDALRRFPDVECAKDRPDALITDSPRAAAASSLPCLLIDPLACSPAELESLADAPVMPAHQWRFRPDVQAVRESLGAGELGIPGLLRIHSWEPASPTPLASRLAAAAQVDLAHWLFSSPPTAVHGLARPDYLQVHLGFAGDGMALIDVHSAAAGPYYSLHLLGSDGAAYADDHHNRPLFLNRTGRPLPPHDPGRELTLENLLAEFLTGLREQRPWRVTIADTLAARHTLEKACHA